MKKTKENRDSTGRRAESQSHIPHCVSTIVGTFVFNRCRICPSRRISPFGTAQNENVTDAVKPRWPLPGAGETLQCECSKISNERRERAHADRTDDVSRRSFVGRPPHIGRDGGEVCRSRNILRIFATRHVKARWNPTKWNATSDPSKIQNFRLNEVNPAPVKINMSRKKRPECRARGSGCK